MSITLNWVYKSPRIAHHIGFLLKYEELRSYKSASKFFRKVCREKHYPDSPYSTGCGAVGSVPALGAGGRRFEPGHPDNVGVIISSGRSGTPNINMPVHRLRNIVPWCNGNTGGFGPSIPGSNPGGITTGLVAELVDALDLGSSS